MVQVLVLLLGKACRFFGEARGCSITNVDIIVTEKYRQSPKTILMTIGKKESSIIPKYPNSIGMNKGIPF